MKYKLKSNHKPIPAIENSHQRYYLYDNMNSVFDSKKQAISASLEIAIKLCVYPEIMLNEPIITQTSLDEITCQTHHIKYSNSPLTVSILLSFLGDDTTNDRYNYAHYVLQEYQHPQKILVKLRKKYLIEGIKQLKKKNLFHYVDFIDFKNFKLENIKPHNKDNHRTIFNKPNIPSRKNKYLLYKKHRKKLKN